MFIKHIYTYKPHVLRRMAHRQSRELVNVCQTRFNLEWQAKFNEI